MGYEPFRNSAWFGRKPRFTSFALFDQMQSDATFGQLDTVQKIHAAMVLASLSVECEQRYMYTAISKTCWFSSNPILLKRDICIFLKPKETLRALLFCQFSEYPCCCTRGHTKQSQHTLWTKNRFATLVGLVGNPVSRVFHVSTKCSPAATVQALFKRFMLLWYSPVYLSSANSQRYTAISKTSLFFSNSIHELERGIRIFL